jgi:hypothetical protein
MGKHDPDETPDSADASKTLPNQGQPREAKGERQSADTATSNEDLHESHPTSRSWSKRTECPVQALIRNDVRVTRNDVGFANVLR